MPKLEEPRQETPDELQKMAEQIVATAEVADKLETLIDEVDEALGKLAERSWPPFREWVDAAGQMHSYLRYLSCDENMRSFENVAAALAWLKRQRGIDDA